MAKNSFVLYTDYYDQIKLLSKEDAGQLLFDLMQYVKDQTEPDYTEDQGMLTMAFSFIKAQIDRDNAKYNETIEQRKAAGSKGGQAKVANASKVKQKQAKVANASKGKQTVANVADNVYVNDNDNVNVNDNDINTKTAHGENGKVLLSQKEYDRLVERHGQEMADKAVDFLDQYLKDNPKKKYSSHKQTIEKWVIDAVKEADLRKREIRIREERADRAENNRSSPGVNGKIHNFDERNYDYDELLKDLL